MKNTVKKALYVGLGLATLKTQEAKKFIRDMEKKGIMTRRETYKLTKDLLKKSNIIQKKISNEVDMRVNRALKGKKIITKAELKKIENKIKKEIMKNMPKKSVKRKTKKKRKPAKKRRKR